ncbi:hypothetical protein LCGC14_2559390 [marine sediment metagenome]|uniref:Uncharacterized protein n=1 Tax=marine sediment metagenome TaxID=412755 RepID=A0A0F9DDJ7_9ZZZZ
MGLNFGSNMFERNINEALTDRNALAGDWTRLVDEGTLTITTSVASGENTIYTIPGGKSFYLFGVSCSSTATNVTVTFQVRNPSSTVVYKLECGDNGSGQGSLLPHLELSFAIPIKFPAGYFFQSGIGVNGGTVSYYGYEIDE